MFIFVLKKTAPPWVLIFAALSLMLFAWLLTLHPESSGRIYATYGGIYVIVSLIWLRVIENVKLSAYDLVGAAIIIIGTLVITSGWRSS